MSRLQSGSLAAVSDTAHEALHALSALGGGAHQAPDAGDHVPGDAEVGDGEPCQRAGGRQHGHQAAGQGLGDRVQTGAATSQTPAIRTHIEHLALNTTQACRQTLSCVNFYEISPRKVKKMTPCFMFT